MTIEFLVLYFCETLLLPPHLVYQQNRFIVGDMKKFGRPSKPSFNFVKLPLSPKWLWVPICLIHALFWAGLSTTRIRPFFDDTMHRFGPGCDFFALYQAGYNAWHGTSIYGFGHTVVPYTYPFRYLPVVAYSLGGILNLVPPITAYALWLGVCELCLIYNAWLTYSRSGRGLRGILLSGIWLVFAPFFSELWVGQFTFLLGSMLFWSVLQMDDHRPRAAFGWWLASLLYKPAALLWLPLWLRERRFRVGLLSCVALLLSNLLYFIYFPKDWAVFREANIQQLPTWHAGNIGLSGLIYQFTGEGLWFKLIRSTSTFLLVAPALLVTWRRNSQPFWRIAALWTILYFLLYKDVWEHHLTMLLPFMVLSLWHTPSRFVVVLIILLALPSPFVFYDMRGLDFNVDPQPYFSTKISILDHSWRVLPLMALYICWLRESLNHHRFFSGNKTGRASLRLQRDPA